MQGADVALPISLPGDMDTLEAHQNLDEPHTSMFRDRLEVLQECDHAWIQADTDGKVRRAMLHKTRPSRGPFVGGPQVYIWLRRGKTRGNERKWEGPAVVICSDGRNYRTSLRGNLVKTGPDHMRYATVSELRAAQLVAAELALQSKQLRNNKGIGPYLDLTSQGGDAPMEEPPPSAPSGMAEPFGGAPKVPFSRGAAPSQRSPRHGHQGHPRATMSFV